MGRRYVAVLDALPVSAECDLFYIEAPSTAVVVLHEVVVTQDLSETSEQLPLGIYRTATDDSTNGTAITPRPLEAGDTAFSGVVKKNFTGAALAAETIPLYRQSQNVLGGWHILFTPETRPVISPSGTNNQRMVIKLETAPTAQLTMSGYIVIEEIGG